MRNIIFYSLALVGVIAEMIHINDSTFHKEVLQSKEPCLVAVVADFCPYCKKFLPTFEATAKLLEGKVKVMKFATPDKYLTPIMAELGTKNYPTIFYWDQEKRNYGNPKKTTWTMGQTELDMQEFVDPSKKVPNPVVVVDEKNFDELIGNSQKRTVLGFFTEKMGMKYGMRNAALNLEKSDPAGVQVGLSESKELAKRFGAIEEGPTFYTWAASTDKNTEANAVEYEGNEAPDDFMGLVNPAEAPKSKGTAVTRLTQKNFDKEIFGQQKQTLLVFTAPWCGHCNKLIPTFNQVAEHVKNKGKDTVFAQAYREKKDAPLYDKFDAHTYPTIIYWPKGVEKTVENAVLYKGGRTFDDLLDHVEPKLVRRNIVTVQSVAKFEEIARESTKSCMMLTLTITGCPHCNNVKPIYKELADNHNCVFLNSNDNQAVFKHFNDTDFFPAVFFWEAGKEKTVETAQKYIYQPQYFALSSAIQYRWGGALKSDEEFQKTAKLEKLMADVTSVDMLHESCSGQLICVVAFLPQNDIDRYQDLLEMIVEADHENNKYVYFHRATGGAYPDFEKFMGLQSNKYPIMAAYSPAHDVTTSEVINTDHDGEAIQLIQRFVNKVFEGKATLYKTGGGKAIKDDL